MRGLGLTAIALGAVAACSSFSGDTPPVAPSNDAGTPVGDGGTVSTNPEAGLTTPTCPEKFEVCDHFESTGFDTNVWTPKQNNGMVSIVEATPGPLGATSNHALRSTRQGGSRGDAFLEHLIDRPQFPITVAARAWVKVGAIKGTYVLTFSSPQVDGAGTAPFIHGVQADNVADKWMIESAVDTKYTAIPSKISVQIDTWTCLELIATFKTTPLGHLTLFVDGQLAADDDVPLYDQAELQNWNELSLEPGMIESDGNTAQTVDVDDVVEVVLTDAPAAKTPVIGCN